MTIPDSAYEQEWLRRQAATALEHAGGGDYEQASAVVEEMMESGFVTPAEPAGALCATLLPLADHVAPAATTERLLYALPLAVGQPQHAVGAVRLATVLMLGGLADEALRLVSYTGPLIAKPEDAAPALADFFRAAVECGRGDAVLPRYAAPRWQMLHRLGAGATCAELAANFAVVGGAAGALPEVGELSARLFKDTPVGRLTDASDGTLRFDPVGEPYDPELAAFARGLLTSAPFHPSMLPHAAAADTQVSRVYGDLLRSRQDEKPRIRNEMAALSLIFDDGPARDALEVLLLSAVTVPGELPGPVGLGALPLLANLDPQQAVVHALDLAQRLRQPESTAVHNLLDFAGGLIHLHGLGQPVLERFAEIAGDAGRPMDALAAITIALRRRPPNYWPLQEKKSFLLNDVAAPSPAAHTMSQCAHAASAAGVAEDTVRYLAAAMNFYMDAMEDRKAAPLFADIGPKLDVAEAGRKLTSTTALEGAAAAARYAARLRGASHELAWPEARARFIRHAGAPAQKPPQVVEAVQSLTHDLTEGGYHDEAVALSAWALAMFRQRGEHAASLMAAGENALALAGAQRHEEAASALEDVWNSASIQNNEDVQRWAEGYLGYLGERSPAYLRALGRLVR